MSRKKYLSVEQIWDANRQKLLVMVVGAKDLALPAKGLDCYVTLKTGGQTLKTRVARKKGQELGSPKWDEIFFFDALGNDLVLEIWGKQTVSKKYLGAATLTKFDGYTPEEVIDKWYDLSPRANKKDTITGKIHLRLYFSVLPETRPLQITDNIFYYDRYMGGFKTGDIIVYSGAGLLASLNKITTNSPYSGMGMIMELPNRWTEKYELYIVEVTRNLDRLVNVFTDDALSGVNIFRLVERIHHFHGHKVWWLPLKKALEQTEGENMVEWIWNVHDRVTAFIDEKTGKHVEDAVVGFINQKFNLKGGKPDVVELFGAEFISRALKAANRLPAGVDPSKATPLSVISYDCFFDPILLREKSKGAQNPRESVNMAQPPVLANVAPPNNQFPPQYINQQPVMYMQQPPYGQPAPDYYQQQQLQQQYNYQLQAQAQQPGNPLANSWSGHAHSPNQPGQPHQPLVINPQNGNGQAPAQQDLQPRPSTQPPAPPSTNGSAVFTTNQPPPESFRGRTSTFNLKQSRVATQPKDATINKNFTDSRNKDQSLHRDNQTLYEISKSEPALAEPAAEQPTNGVTAGEPKDEKDSGNHSPGEESE